MVPRFFVPRKTVVFIILREEIMEVKDKKPLIYLISGKARHGKDTTAAMIKNYYETK